MNFIQVPDRDGLCHKRSNAFIERAINNQIGTLTFRPTLVLERRPFAKNGRRIEINMMARTGHRCFATCRRSSVKLLRGAGGPVQCTIAIVSRSLSIAFSRYTIRLSDESSRMAKRKRRIHRRRLLEAPYHVEYFALKHDISAEQARELMRRLGRDRDKLNEAAAKLFRR
jgi:hypothetical protein